MPLNKYTQPLGKKEKRLNTNLWARPNSQLNRGSPTTKPTHSHTKESAYSLKLKEKQKIKLYYGLSEKQLRNLYDKLATKSGDKSTRVATELERRLHSACYRARWGTMGGIRQLIQHGHVLVNDKRVDIKSYMLKDGDKISLSEKARNIPHLGEKIQKNSKTIPVYIESAGLYDFVFNRAPDIAEIPFDCALNFQALIEFYSK